MYTVRDLNRKGREGMRKEREENRERREELVRASADYSISEIVCEASVWPWAGCSPANIWDSRQSV